MNLFKTVIVMCLFLYGAVAIGKTCASPGLDGPAVLTGILNSYHAGSGSAAADTNQVTVALLTGQRTSTRNLGVGDLVLIMQMQDSATPTTAGLHENAQISSEPAA